MSYDIYLITFEHIWSNENKNGSMVRCKKKHPVNYSV